MASSISSNISAYYAQSNLTRASEKTQTSISRLSSGNKITRASDDVAALSIGTILRTDVSTLKTALVNANQGTTLLQIADGALARVGEILQRQKALSTQALSGTLGTKERGYLDQEFQALKTELDRIAGSTNFNGINLIDGNLVTGGSVITQEATAANITAALTDSNDTIDVAILTGGASAFAVSDNGTANNATLNKLFGSLADISVSVTDGSTGTLVNATININGVSFSTVFDGIDLDAAGSDIAFTATDGSGVVITLDIADQGVTTVDQTAATAFKDDLQAELRKLSLYQAKAISKTSGDEGAILATDTDGTILDGMDGDDFVIRAKGGFGLDPAATSATVVKATAPSMSNFQITSHSATSATFSVEVDGVTYTARRATVDGDIRAQDFGSDADSNDLSPSGGVLKMYNLDDLNSYVTIDFGGLTAASAGVTSQSEADRIATEFNRLFGSGSSGGASFAIGTNSSDAIVVSIDSVKTTALYKSEDGTLNTLDIKSASSAKTASDTLDLAIQRVTAARANVGALQSRFSYAAAAIEVSVQNLDAARGVFLDADVSEESTNFATAQVLQQASISVLAQANQLPQNLLKLIG